MTLGEIAEASRVVLMVTGADKAAALADVATGHSGLPAERVQAREGPPLWLVDVEAASLLEPRDADTDMG
jgi:6-phosphogluconolactonase/glucosamine-6-phosphate isomerase/deaminase